MKNYLLILSLGLITSCSTLEGRTQALMNRATFDFNCSDKNLTIKELNYSAGGIVAYGVQGCDKKGVYVVSGNAVNGYQAILNTDLNKLK